MPVHRARLKIELHNAIQRHFGRSDVLLGIRIGKIEKAEPVKGGVCSWTLPDIRAPDEYHSEMLAIVADVREKFPLIIRPVNG